MGKFINFDIYPINMSRKIIIAYSLKGIKTPLKITRKIYGYTECSNNNQYQYERKGILSNIKYEKISKACIIINQKDATIIIKEFKKLKIKMKVLEIELKKIRNFG